MNELIRTTRAILGVGCAAVLLCISTQAQSQALHRQVDAVGRITYSDLPHGRTKESADAPAGLRPMSTKRAAAVDATEASRRLLHARLQREQGFVPLPGERHSGAEAAVNHRYWRRQAELRQAVEHALRRTNETRLALLALR